MDEQKDKIINEGTCASEVTNEPKQDSETEETKGNVIQFPSSDGKPADTEKDIPEEEKDLIDDPENPLNEVNERQIKKMLNVTREVLQAMEANWNASKEEFHVTDSQMKELFQFNEQNKTSIPEYATDEEREHWDHFNGLDKITEEEIDRIFGEDHPIIGVTHDVTKDRIKDLCEDYINWMIALREYKDIHQSYIKLIEIQEEKNIEELRIRAEAETNPDQKKKMEDAIDLYYNRKYLRFLAEPLSDDDRNRLVHAFNTERTISYWVKRSQDKLKQIKAPSKFILEISQFEKRFLPEKYHKQSNILLLYFMMTIIYCSCSDPKDPGRNKSIAMIMTLDQFVQNILEDDKRAMVLNNIIAFEDQFVDLIQEQPKSEDE